MELLSFIKENHLIVIPVLFIIGKIIKDCNKIDNEYIPFILLFIGIISSIGLEKAISIDSFFQGVITTGLTVYGNEAIKQILIIAEDNNDEENNDKEEEYREYEELEKLKKD